MATCSLCEKGGWFARVNAQGLCDRCSVVFGADLGNRQRVLAESLELMEKSKSLPTRLSRCYVAIEQAEALLPYEERGILYGISIQPSKMIAEFRIRRDEIIVEHLDADIQKAIHKAELAATARAAITAVNGALLKLKEAENNLIVPGALVERKSHLEDLAHQLELRGHLSAAEKAEFKGQVKKAIDAYKEALYFLKTDEIDDAKQDRQIKDLEKKVTDLQPL